MSFKVQCRCGQQMSVEEAQVGLRFGCVGCSQPFVVPANPTSAAVVPIAAAPVVAPVAPPPAPPQYQPPPYQQQPMPQANVYINSQPKNAGVAAVLSFLWCGLGQIYNGDIGKGIAFIFIYGFAILLCFVLIGFIIAPIVWLIGIVDAYTSAERINRAAGFQQYGGPRQF